jgi:hypothetical protein
MKVHPLLVDEGVSDEVVRDLVVKKPNLTTVDEVILLTMILVKVVIVEETDVLIDLP